MNLINRKVFAKNLNKYIEINGKTRREVCDKLGFPYSTFSDWANGNSYPRIDRIEKIADYFNIEKSDLIEEKTDYEFESKMYGAIISEKPHLKELFNVVIKLGDGNIKVLTTMAKVMLESEVR